MAEQTHNGSAPEPASGSSAQNGPTRSTGPLTLLRRIGPAIVVAAVVLGPGSIVSASKLGCQYQYDLLWLIPVASVLMIALTMTSMTIGAVQDKLPCQAVAESFGRPAAVAVGLAMLTAVTLFQASNNNAMLMALEGFIGKPEVPADTQELVSPEQVPPEKGPAHLGQAELLRIGGMLGFNLFVIGLMWISRRNLYRMIEKAMAWLVGAMVLAFAVNLLFAKPSLSGIAQGLIPKLPSEQWNLSGSTEALMTMGAMVATTFSVAAAFYQAYQVREKGWTQKDLAVGRLDSVVGIGALGLITMMILICGAAGLYGIDPATLTDAAAVAIALEPLFGDSARYVFAIGVLAGAVSSFLVNALIGAVVFCDAINQPTSLSKPVVRAWTVIALLLGWAVASFAVIAQIELANFIVFAQCLTVVAIPVLGISIIWQARQLPSGTLPRWVMPVNYVGLLVVLALAARTVIKLAS